METFKTITFYEKKVINFFSQFVTVNSVTILTEKKVFKSPLSTSLFIDLISKY